MQPAVLRVLERIEQRQRDQAADIAELRRQLHGTASASPATELEPPADESAAELLETAEATARFNVPEDTLRSWCRKGLVGTKRGGRWRFDPTELQEFLRQRR